MVLRARERFTGLSRNASLWPVSRMFRKVFALGKPQQNLKPYNCRAVLFTLHIPNMNTGCLHARCFRPTHLSVLRKRSTENDGFASPKTVSGAFEKRFPSPRIQFECILYSCSTTILYSALYNISTNLDQCVVRSRFT